jgi:microcompartment protein CcmL/EutN
MMQKALGLIETIGLVPAIEAADAAVKATNVVLLGYENTKGGGKITVKLAGDVGAVQAAVSAGVAAALRIGKVYGCLVIPRPHEEIRALIQQVDRPQKQKAAVTRASAAPVVEQPAAETLEPPSVTPDLSMDAPALDLTDQPLPKTQCSAITKSGERCKAPARSGSKYCIFHRKLES